MEDEGFTIPRTFYISVPIFGKADLNEPYARLVAQQASMALYVRTLVPHDIAPMQHEGACPPGRKSEGSDHSDACYLRADIEEMLRRCGGIVMGNGWTESVGCKLEFNVAVHCGFEVWQHNTTRTQTLTRIGG